MLGVAIREGYDIWFQKTTIGKGHAYQMTASEMIEVVKDRIQTWNCEYIFLTCQTNETVNLFKQTFSDKLIIYPRKRSIIEGHQAHSLRTCEEERQNELDYITEMNLLACCCCMICSQNSGTEAAFIMSDGFEHFECLDKGKKKG